MSDESSESPSIPRDVNGRFLPGGPGRPAGARGRASRAVAQAILADFTAHQDEVLPKLRRWFLPQYVALIGRLMPKGGDEGLVADGREGLDGLDPEMAARLMAAARVALTRIEAGEGTLADLEAALTGTPPPLRPARASAGVPCEDRQAIGDPMPLLRSGRSSPSPASAGGGGEGGRGR